MITEFKEYSELPFSKTIQNELLIRHSHASIENNINENQIVYTEKNVLILLQLQQNELSSK